MDKKQAKERIEELRKITEYHAKKYYDDDSPEISDFEYDMLMVELRNLEKDFPEFKDKNSLTQKVGGKVKEGFQKVEHEVPLQSLQDIFDFEELYAFDERIGYLTQCPTNLGTGMRASVMLHLPALTMSGQIHKLINTISKLGLAFRGAYGEGTKAVGDMYQLSNQITLGISEEFAIKNLKAITLQLCAQERSARQELLKSIHTEDAIFRAYGTLKWARLLTSTELMTNLSLVRLGSVAGKINVPIETLNELMVSMQPANINSRAGQRLDSQERDEIRAAEVRKKLG